MSSTSDAPAKVTASVSGKVAPGGRSSRGDWPFATTKIQPSHQERLAIVYVRQSSPQQVLMHRESAELQYELARQAVALGWPQERVLVIDEDQGQSATSAEARQGFQQLLAEVSLDHVGLVLGIEMSRLLVCGKCGCRMMVRYAGSPPRVSYARRQVEYAEPFCQNLAGKALDELILRQVLRVLEPAALELSLQAAEDSERERGRLHHHWQQRLERARYESDRAARQYHAVEPENRLVARQLEHLWEESLRESRELEEAYDRSLQEQPAALTVAEHESIRALAADVPALLQAPTTTAADRQTVVRHLVERVVVAVQGESELVDVSVEWAGGYASQHQLIRSVARYEQLRHYQELLARAVELRDAGRTTAQIAEQLNREGWRPPKRRATFNGPMVRALLSRRAQPGPRPRPADAASLLGPHEWWFTDLAQRLDMPHPTLYSWLRRGWVHSRQLPGAQGRWILWADEEELDRLKRLRTCPHTWCDQPLFRQLTSPKSRTENK
jgi:hypothetical protein